MWALRNETSYTADRTWVRDAAGRHHWIVVVKATFEFDAHGSIRLADEQLPPLHEPEYLGEPGASSLRYEADLVATKPGTDVTVNASAHAPHGRAVSELAVGLRVANVDKQLLVRGPTIHGFSVGSARASTPAPFVIQPIIYELAFGGTDTLDDNPANHRIDPRNPVGVGFATRVEHLVGRTAPSVYYPRGDPARVGPAGFGAIASYWSPRLELAGTYNETWARTKKPLLPDDHDPAHLLCAPADQRLDRWLRGGEQIGLVNLTPAGVLVLELPKISLACDTKINARTLEHACALVSVVVEPDEGRLIMAWQSSLHVGGMDVDYLDETRIRELPASW